MVAGVLLSGTRFRRNPEGAVFSQLIYTGEAAQADSGLAGTDQSREWDVSSR